MSLYILKDFFSSKPKRPSPPTRTRYHFIEFSWTKHNLLVQEGRKFMIMKNFPHFLSLNSTSIPNEDCGHFLKTFLPCHVKGNLRILFSPFISSRFMLCLPRWPFFLQFSVMSCYLIMKILH